MLNDVLRVGSGGPLGNRNEVIGGHGGRRRGNFICVSRISRVVPLPAGEGVTSTGRIRITIGGDGCLVRSSFLHIFEDHFTVYAVGISDGMARHCDFTGGDGEGDLFRICAAADREGRFAVEGGVVCTVDLRLFDRQRVDRDGVGVGIGIGGYLLFAYRVGRFIFGKRCLIQFPFFHLVFAKGFRRDAGGQGILDRAGVQAGDDRLSDFCKFCVQLLCIARIIGKFLTCFWLRRNFSSQIFTDGNLAPVVRNINCFTCIKADRVELGRNVLNPCRSVNRTIVYLIGALRAITMKTILRAADRQFGSKQMPRIVAVFLQAVRWLTIRQGNHVLDCTVDVFIIQQILRIGQTGIQVRTAFRAQSLDVFQNFLINIRIRYVDPRLYGFSLFCKRHNGDVTAKVAAVLIGCRRTVCVERQAAVGFQEILRSNLRGIQTGCTCGFEVNIIVSESVWGRVLSIFVTFKPARIMLIIRVISVTIIGTFELFFFHSCLWFYSNIDHCCSVYR